MVKRGFLALIMLLAPGGCTARELGRYAQKLGQNRAALDYGASARYAAVTKGANLRMSPSETSEKVTFMKAGTLLRIKGEESGWLEVEGGSKTGPISGYVRADLVDEDAPTAAKINESVAAASAGNSGRGQSSNTSQKTRKGYALEFASTRERLKNGELTAVLDDFRVEDRIFKDDQGEHWKDRFTMLDYLERGMIRLGTAETAAAAADFREAEAVVKTRQDRSIIAAGAEDAVRNVAAFVTGTQALTTYEGADYEYVLALDFASLAYLLEGKRASYNVARRAIDWQQMAQKAFEIERAKVELELERAEYNRRKSKGIADVDLINTIKKHYEPLEQRATRVPSAYVNPFGYYLAGVVQEIASAEDQSLRDNAAIAYSKALELSPGNAILAKAAGAARKAPASDKRILHVIAAAGFSPDKEVVEFPVTVPSYPSAVTAPVRLPIFQPIDDSVATIEIQTPNGKKLDTLTSVADIEALSLRHQRDSLPSVYLFVSSTLLRSFGTKTLLNNIGLAAFGGNQLVGDSIDAIGEPDSRAWMSLPQRILASRVEIPKSLASVRIVSKDSKGRTLNSEVVTLDTRTDAVCYVRATEKTLLAKSNDPLWLVDDTKRDLPTETPVKEEKE